MPKTWDDQPDEVEDVPIRATLSLGDGLHAEVRNGGRSQPYFLTVGNLFGSQTVKCPDADGVLTVLGIARSGKTSALPNDADLLPNKEATPCH